MAVSQGSGVPKASKNEVDIRNQHDGILDKPQTGSMPIDPNDRKDRVLNYPGLAYFYDKIKNGLKADIGDIDFDALTDPEVRRILAGWGIDDIDDEGWATQAGVAEKLKTARQIGISSPSGVVTGHVNFDGSEDVVIEVTHNWMGNQDIQNLFEYCGLLM